MGTNDENGEQEENWWYFFVLRPSIIVPLTVGQQLFYLCTDSDSDSDSNSDLNLLQQQEQCSSSLTQDMVIDKSFHCMLVNNKITGKHVK